MGICGTSCAVRGGRRPFRDVIRALLGPHGCYQDVIGGTGYGWGPAFAGGGLIPPVGARGSAGAHARYGVAVGGSGTSSARFWAVMGAAGRRWGIFVAVSEQVLVAVDTRPPFLARGRHVSAWVQVGRVSSRPWAGNVRVGPGRSRHFSPVGGKCSRRPRSVAPFLARGRELSASAQVGRVSCCPWAGSVRVGAGGRRQLPPVGGKRPRRPRWSASFAARGREKSGRLRGGRPGGDRCQPSPRYALRTSSLASNSAPVPEATIRPTSRTYP